MPWLTSAADPSSVIEDHGAEEEAGWWFSDGGEFLPMPPGARTRRQTIASLFPTSVIAEPRYQAPTDGKSANEITLQHVPVAD